MGAGNYLILRYAPAGANVKVRLGSNTAPAIDMIQDDSIEGVEVSNIYIECDAVPGEYIEFIQAKNSETFKITPAPAIKNIDVDNFFIPNNDSSYTITAGASLEIDTTNTKALRFYASDEVGVSLDNSAIKYPMLEDMVFTRDVDSLAFYNDTAADVTLIVWEM